MKKLLIEPSRSAGRRSTSLARLKKRVENRQITEDHLNNMIDAYKTFEQQKLEAEQDPEWQKNNLEWDLRTTDWILEKTRNSDLYAQNLYAALCNNGFQRQDVWQILKDQTWSCTWRYAGGIIADMRQEGDYIDWYCSGIRGGIADHDADVEGPVSEGEITDEIRQDLARLGWHAVTG